jgi:uncharacterized membrane protein
VTESRARAATGVLALVGAAISAYFVAVRATGGVPVCATGGCELVQGSEYSELGGIPVATIGLAGYLLFAATAAVRGPLAAATGLFLALVAAAFGVYLLVVQVAVIDAICQWCLASEVVSFLLLPLAILRVGAVNAGAATALPAGRPKNP